jgi:hypothetical protein
MANKTKKQPTRPMPMTPKAGFKHGTRYENGGRVKK